MLFLALVGCFKRGNSRLAYILASRKKKLLCFENGQATFYVLRIYSSFHLSHLFLSILFLPLPHYSIDQLNY